MIYLNIIHSQDHVVVLRRHRTKSGPIHNHVTSSCRSYHKKLRVDLMLKPSIATSKAEWES